MPPLLDPGESDNENEIASKREIVKADEDMQNDADDPERDEEDAGDGEENEEEFVVERIEAHEWDSAERCYKYKTKWVGWEEETDRTWEPKENLEGAQESLDEYWEGIGGEPSPPAPKQKKRSRPSGPESELKKARISPAPAKSGRGRKLEPIDDPDNWGPTDDKEWEPPKATKDAWEDQLIAVETIEPDERGTHWAYLRWAVLDRNGKHRHTKHPLAAVYKAAPQIMLKFYEKHLVFSDKAKKME